MPIFYSIRNLLILLLLTTVVWLVDMDSIADHPVLVGYGWYMWPTFLIQMLVAAMIMSSFFVSRVRLEIDWTKVWWRRWLGKALTNVAWLIFTLAGMWTFMWLFLYTATERQMPVNFEDKFVLMNTICLSVPALILFVLGREIGQKK